MTGGGWEFFYRLIFPFVALVGGLLDFAWDYPLFVLLLVLMIAMFFFVLYGKKVG